MEQEIEQAKQRIIGLESEKRALQTKCQHAFSGNAHFIRCRICGKVEVLYY